MWTVFLYLLVPRLAGSTVGENYETKTVNVGEAVTMSCPRDYSQMSSQLFWFRLVSGALPEFLGGTFNFDNKGVVKTSQWTAKQEHKTFVLILDKTQLSDNGLYFCIRQAQIEATILKAVFLSVTGPDITKVIHDISSDPASPRDPRTLQCSVLYDPDSKPCPGEHRVIWFRAGSEGSGPSFIYTHGNRSVGCEQSSETPSLQKCTYSFPEAVSSSDEETFYCAVAACGEVLFGNGTKLKAEGKTATFELGLVITLVCLLISLIGNIACISYHTARAQNASDLQKSSSAQKNQQTGVETNILSVAVFTLKETARGPEERERIYTAVKAFGLN